MTGRRLFYPNEPALGLEHRLLAIPENTLQLIMTTYWKHLSQKVLPEPPVWKKMCNGQDGLGTFAFGTRSFLNSQN